MAFLLVQRPVLTQHSSVRSVVDSWRGEDEISVEGKDLMGGHLSSPCCSGGTLHSHTLYNQKETWFWFRNPGTGMSKQVGQGCYQRERVVFRQASWRPREELVLHFWSKSNLKTEFLLPLDTSGVWFCFVLFPEGFHN